MQTGVYEFLAQDRVIYGRPAAGAVAETVATLGKRRPLIVASRTLSRSTGVVAAIRDALGDACAGVFDDCVEHVPRASVLALADEVRRLQPDLIVTVGGGTPVDTVKVALVALAEGIADTAGFDAVRIRVAGDGTRVVPAVKDPPLRQIIVPTTLSGAEFSSLGGATDPERRVKDLYTGRHIGGQVVILDPAVTVHTPERLWLSTGIRAIDHAVETVCSRGPQPFTDATGLHGLAMLGRSLRANRERPDDLGARLESQLGVWLATTGLGRVDWGASHGIGHQLGAVAGVPHGHCSCVMLPAVLRWNRPVNADRQALVARALGREDGDAAVAVADLVRDLGQPGSLRAVGVTPDQFAAIAAGAMQNMMVRSNPRAITREDDVREILELAW
ncbi:iron-containing alcohol dehydrogenase [Azospirillum agricola]|uniref:iron-containing alcohol dehydrogenase n=1 Tax=Azospirillum agricola TaxID=1720247 RepID=UPI000A0EFBA3|nr:iron-containing alcohol dehydrogenase [Azospirillum agricola]SMH39321.1 Alcohol dehydrogenase, class IV [Azospirillum lipoferum]